MPMLKRADAEIHYEVHGNGFPLLLYAPGGLRSNIEFWGPGPDGVPRSWMDPRTALADRFTVISMDQRNAGKSVADVKPDHGWHTFAADHLALMDHLGFGKFHVMGGCIGGSYCFKAIEQAPDRVFVKVCRTPLFLQPGNDKPHPGPTSDEIAALAPDIVIQKDWRGPEFLAQSIRQVGAFLEKHTPT